MPRRRERDIANIKIRNKGDFFDLYGGDTFATLLEIVNYYLENSGMLRERGGQEIIFRYPMLCEDPTQERWFHGYLESNLADDLLKRHDNGSYLVRASQSSPGDYVLSARCENVIKNIKIKCTRRKYSIGGTSPSFSSIRDLVNYYIENPIVQHTGELVTLQYPVNATKFPLSTLAKRIQQLQSESNANSNSFKKRGFAEEFDTVQQTLQKGEALKRNAGSKPENRNKNRYANILPYDHTRVKLTDFEEGDYINANYITVSDGSIGYIAAQAPLPNTIHHFWQAIEQTHCNIIINTTTKMELASNKTILYYPEDEVPQQYGYFIITLVERSQFGKLYYRSQFFLENQKTKQSRYVWFFHFTDWPDHEIPESSQGVLNFLDDIRDHSQKYPSSGPWLVHCSAGIGRTGTFIAVDVLKQICEKEGLDAEVDVQHTIFTMRSERSGMVQTETQYKFVYTSLLTYIEGNYRKHEIGQSNFSNPNHKNIAAPIKIHNVNIQQAETDEIYMATCPEDPDFKPPLAPESGMDVYGNANEIMSLQQQFQGAPLDSPPPVLENQENSAKKNEKKKASFGKRISKTFSSANKGKSSKKTPPSSHRASLSGRSGSISSVSEVVPQPDSRHTMPALLPESSTLLPVTPPKQTQVDNNDNYFNQTQVLDLLNSHQTQNQSVQAPVPVEQPYMDDEYSNSSSLVEMMHMQQQQTQQQQAQQQQTQTQHAVSTPDITSNFGQLNINQPTENQQQAAAPPPLPPKKNSTSNPHSGRVSYVSQKKSSKLQSYSDDAVLVGDEVFEGSQKDDFSRQGEKEPEKVTQMQDEYCNSDNFFANAIKDTEDYSNIKSTDIPSQNVALPSLPDRKPPNAGL